MYNHVCSNKNCKKDFVSFKKDRKYCNKSCYYNDTDGSIYNKIKISAICRKCKISLNSNNWKQDRSGNICISCLRDSRKKWKNENREKINAWGKNPEYRAHRRQVRRDNPERAIFYSCKSRAKKLNLPFTISISDIIIPDTCPVLGIPLFHGYGLACDNSPSIDRIVPELGYIPSNIIIMSYRANTLKNNASIEELQTIINWLSRRI